MVQEGAGQLFDPLVNERIDPETRTFRARTGPTAPAGADGTETREEVTVEG